MQEHPVPQNITSFEFKLIGDMTLRQFGYVGTGIALALIFFFAKPLSPWIRFPFVFLCPALGFALAFMPVEGRSLDRWLVSFIHAVFGNTLYIWKKEGIELEALHGLQLPVQAQAPQGSQTAAGSAQYMKGALAQKPKNSLDQEELRILHGVQTNFTTTATPRVMQNRVPLPVSRSPVQTPIRPHVPMQRTYAGPIAPSNVLHAQPMMAQTPQQRAPTVMRLPHQKPLAPRKIPLPSYQAASLQRASQVAASTAQPVPPGILHMMQPSQPSSPAPSSIVHNPLAHTPGSILQPTQAAVYQQAARELAMLKQQNDFLFNKLKNLEVAMQNSAQKAALPTQPQNLTQETETLNTHISALETMLKDVVGHVNALHTQEQQYKDLLAQIQGQLSGVSHEKIQAEEELHKLEQNAQSAADALKSSETERESLEQKLKELETKLKETQLASVTVQSKEVSEPQAINTPEAAATIPKKELPKEPELPKLYANTTPPVPPPLPEGLSLIVQAKEVKVTQAPPTPAVAEQPSMPVEPPKETPTAPKFDYPLKPVPIAEKPKKVFATPPVEKPAPAVFAKPAAMVEKSIPEHIDRAIKSLPTITSTPNAISGYAFDEQAKPIMDVIIVVKKSQGPTMRALKTNRVGQFSIVSPLPDGEYEVSFEKEGFTFTDMAIVAKGEVIPPIKVLGHRTN